MGHKIKTVGIAFAAILALSASSASASTSGLTTPNANQSVILTGNQTTKINLKFAASGVNIGCNVNNFAGTATSNANRVINEFTVKTTYATCVLGGLTASVTTGTCEHTITDTETTLIARRDIVNCGANNIAVTQGACVINFGNQVQGGHIGFANSTGINPDDVNITLTVNGIAYNGGPGCPANILGSRNDGSLTGGYTLRAYADNGGSEGVQTNLTAH